MGGMTGLLFLLWVGVTVSTAVNLQKRILGGTKCDRPFHVKIITLHGELECGGSLISDQWILTAAHCWKLGMKAVLGLHTSKPDTMQITAPPKMYGDNNEMVHDVMLLKLPRPTKNEHVKLPDCNTVKHPPIGHKVQMAGRGARAAGPGGKRVTEESDTLQCADIDVVDCQGLRDTLKNKDPESYGVYDYQHWFCAKTVKVEAGQRKVDASHGDSGGGVVYDNKIYGVIAFVGDKTQAFVEPVGFMDVCKYIQWIKTTAGIA